jgi:F0F1-type ATP synthase alpha subunit
VTIYAGINGYLDKLPVEKIRVVESALYEKLDTVAAGLADMIRTKKDLIPEIEEAMKTLIAETVEEVNLGN